MKINLNIPNADEARKAIENGIYAKAQKQAAEVEEVITRAISFGQKYVGGPGLLEPSVKAALTEKGYKCESGSQYNEQYWSISWV